MARRCGCGSTCACNILEGAGISITGTGTAEDPWVVAVDGLEGVHGLPAGGVAGSVLSKASATDYDASWLDLFKQFARVPDQIIVGTITRDANGAATSAPVVWPDGTPGIYTADTVSATFPGAVDAYHITYGNPTVVRTYTQPAVTRDSNGAVTTLPAITVA